MTVVSRLLGVRRSRAVLTLAAAVTLAAPVSAAHAGRLIVTGHDAESHCVRDSPTSGSPGACAFVATGVRWVRATAPDPSRPVLILDRGALDMQRTIDIMAAAGESVPYEVVDPRSPAFATIPLNVGAYSAILIASSKDEPSDATPQDLNDLGATPDTDAINARAADIEAFFNAGGGLQVMSGGAAARANSRLYYGFLKITRGGHAVAAPFSLEPIGRTIGWQDARAFPGERNEINCCETHVSFEQPAPESKLQVAESDTAGRAVTLVGEAAHLAEFEEPLVRVDDVFPPNLPGVSPTGGNTTGGGTVLTGPPSCVPNNKRLKISLRRPKGVRFARVTVYVNGKRTRTVSGRFLGTKPKTRAFTLNLSRTKTSKLRIVVTTASGRRLSYRQTYKPC